MGTPNNPTDTAPGQAEDFSLLNQTPRRLLSSGLEEDHQFCSRALAFLAGLRVKITPLLKYLIHGGDYHQIAQYAGCQLLLSSKGHWGVRCPPNRDVTFPADALLDFPLKDIVKGIHDLTRQARDAREARLASIKAADEKLSKMAAILDE